MSSASNKFVPNKEVVPIINSTIFEGDNINSRFAIGLISSDDVLKSKPGSISEAYLKLRANVYIDQTGMLDISDKRESGIEFDDDDERSSHFVVLENKLGSMAVFACMRLIEKINDKPLPIEEFFPESFELPAIEKSIEVSRFIVRHDDRRQSRLAKCGLMTAGLAYTYKENLGPILGVVEPSFEKDLRIMKLPVKRIAEPKMIEEYNDKNLGIEIDKSNFRELLGSSNVDNMTIPVGGYTFWGEIE